MSSETGLWSRDRHLSPYLHRNPEADLKDPTPYSLGFASAIRDETGWPAGALLCLVSWAEVQGLLDEVATCCQETRQLRRGYAFLFASDADRILAHHRNIYNSWQDQSGEFTGDVHTYTGGLDNTAFGLLFLKKGVLPVFTGRR